MPRKPVLPPISDAEADVMTVLWHTAPLDAQQVFERLAERRGWQLATVKTLINRLLRKGALQAEQDGRRYLYRPAFKREDWLGQQSMSWLDRWFEGRLSPLVSHFARHRKLNQADLEALRRLLKEHERG